MFLIEWGGVKTKDNSEVKEPDLRASMATLQRASLLAHQTTTKTDTHLVIIKDGRLLRLSAEELRQQAEPKDAPTS